jgi:tRNA uridine 5-carboxymethylaminomethyl modification enzyme
MGLASQERMDRVLQKRKEVEELKEVLRSTAIEPEEVNAYFEKIESATIVEKQKAEKILLRPSVGLNAMRKEVVKIDEILNGYSSASVEQAEIQVKYQVYIDKEKELVERMRQLEDLEIPEHFDYQRIISLGIEAREKLNRIRPKTLGQASRISGINPSDVQILMVYMGR